MSVDPITIPSPSPLSITANNPDPPPPRKVPPPCWTPDETFALVHAYRDIWFSLRRRNLRSPDWDAVAASVSRRCPASLPPKSSLQCRHKIEKLRKRYRSEKRRSLAFPARFSSSWDLYPLLDSMEIAVVGPPQGPAIADVPAFRLRSPLPQGFVLRKHGKREDGNSSPNLEGELRCVSSVKVIDDRNLVTTAFGSTSYAKIYGASSSDHHFDDSNSSAGYGVQFSSTQSSVPVGLRARNQSKANSNYAPNLNFDYTVGHGVDTGGRFPVKSLGNRNLMPPGIRSNFDAKLNHYDHSSNYGNDEEGAFYPRMPCDRLVPSGFRSMNYSRVDGSSTSNADSGEQSGSPSRFEKNASKGVKRKVHPIEEMVASIKMLGEGFVHVEMKKMELARELEKMRMDAEMRRNEMMIKSQQQIVNVFINGLLGKKKKVKEEPCQQI